MKTNVQPHPQRRLTPCQRDALSPSTPKVGTRGGPPPPLEARPRPPRPVSGAEPRPPVTHPGGQSEGVNACSILINLILIITQGACSVPSVMSNSLQPYGLYPARLLCPWDSPGKNTGKTLQKESTPDHPPQGNPTPQHLSAPWCQGYRHRLLMAGSLL